jgi:hypothetical protein
MAIARLIAFAGVGAEELAELRGLVARAGELLESPWRIADDHDADLVVVDAAQAEGLLAQTRAVGRGVPCVVLEAEDDPELLLARPFEIDGLMQLLVNAVPRLKARPSAVVGGADQFGYGRADIVPPPPADDLSLADFFAADLIGLIPDARTAGEAAREAARETGAVGAPTDALLLAAVAALPPDAVPGASVPGARASGGAAAASPSLALAGSSADLLAAVAAIPSARVEEAAPLVAEPAAVAPAPPAPADPAPARDAPGDARATPAPRAQYPLVDYLDGSLIGLPSRVALDGAPPLVIDPIAKVFHFAGNLRQLEPYLDALLPRTQWSALLQSQLSLVRREHPGRPFELLRWHQALRRMPPGLPPGLDPGSLYSLRHALDLRADHPRAARIADAMKVPRGLGEIANVAATSVVEVYSVVGAFAAIGWLEQHARQKPGTAAPAKPAARPAPGVPPTRR